MGALKEIIKTIIFSSITLIIMGAVFVFTNNTITVADKKQLSASYIETYYRTRPMYSPSTSGRGPTTTTPSTGTTITPSTVISGGTTYPPYSSGTTSRGTINRLSKWVSANTLGDSVVYEKEGKIGIGENSSGAMLDILSDNYQVLRLQNDSETMEQRYHNKRAPRNEKNYRWNIKNRVDPAIQPYFSLEFLNDDVPATPNPVWKIERDGTSASYQRWFTGSGGNVYERMNIDSMGNIMIGTERTNPTSRLTIKSTDNANYYGLSVQNSNGENLFAVKNDGTVEVSKNINISGKISGATYGFGGMYRTNPNGQCATGNNLASGYCSCPRNFTSQHLGSYIYYCYK